MDNIERIISLLTEAMKEIEGMNPGKREIGMRRKLSYIRAHFVGMKAKIDSLREE